MDKGISVIDARYYVPENVLTNDDLSKIVDTSDEWIYPALVSRNVIYVKMKHL